MITCPTSLAFGLPPRLGPGLFVETGATPVVDSNHRFMTSSEAAMPTILMRRGSSRSRLSCASRVRGSTMINRAMVGALVVEVSHLGIAGEGAGRASHDTGDTNDDRGGNRDDGTKRHGQFPPLDY
jgi:hypothetical protein